MTKLIRILSRPRILMALFVAAVLALSLAALSCQRVSDIAGGVTLQKSDLEKCIQDCNKLADKDTKDETKRHEKALKVCQNDPGCIDRENAKFLADLQQIEARRLECINDCHHQGGASGGR